MRIPAIALLFVVALPLCATTITHPLQEEAGVSIIEVPVYVTSHDGKPVSDLKAENFTLYEDGKKKDLVFAQLMGTGSVGSLPNGIVESRGHFILFFDLTFNQLGGLKRARDAAMQFINEQLPPGESVSVFSFALTDGVKMLLNFTTDRHKVLEAVDSLSFTKARDFLADSAGLVPKPNFLQEPNSSNLAQSMALEDENSLVIRMGIKQMDTMAYRSLVKEYLTQVRDFARSLDVLDGRKYVIFFSAGFDTKVIGGQTLKEAADDAEKLIQGSFIGIDPSSREIDTQLLDLLTTAMSSFSSSDCRLYCIDPSTVAMGVDPGSSTSDSDAVDASLRRQTSLGMFASETGGKVFKNVNDLSGPLSSIVSETRQYYLLAYNAPPGKGDGKYHALKVEINRPGTKASFRKGYYESKPFGKFSDIEKKIQIAEIVNKDRQLNRLAMNVQALIFPGDPRDVRWKDFARVLVQAALPGPQFGTIEKNMEFDIYGFASISNNTIVDYFHGLFKVKDRADLDHIAQGGLSYTDLLLLAPGQYKIKIIIRNNQTGDVGSRDLSLTVPNFSSPGLHMATPCFLAKGSNWMNVRGYDPQHPPERLKNIHIEYPLEYRNKACAAAIYPNLSQPGDHMVLIKLYGIEVDPQTNKPKAGLEWRIIDADGRQKGIPTLSLAQSTKLPDDSYDLLFSIRPPSLEKGIYWLRLQALDPGTSHTAIETIPFFVE